jgi:hypothetical protein
LGDKAAQSNNPVASVDVTGMRTAESKVGAALGAAVLMASVGLAAGAATANAEPTGHTVVYTLTTEGPADFDLYYLETQPPSKAAYDADAYSYLKKLPVSLGPGAPWQFTTTLADPQWAILTVSSTTHGGQAAPVPHCDISVDGQSVVALSAPYNLQCRMPGSQI